MYKFIYLHPFLYLPMSSNWINSFDIYSSYHQPNLILSERVSILLKLPIMKDVKKLYILLVLKLCDSKASSKSHSVQSCQL